MPLPKFVGIFLVLAALVLFILAFNARQVAGWQAISGAVALLVGGGLLIRDARANA